MTGLFYIHSSGIPFVVTDYNQTTSELSLAPTTLLLPKDKPMLRGSTQLHFRLNDVDSLNTFKRQFVCFGTSPTLAEKLQSIVHTRTLSNDR